MNLDYWHLVTVDFNYKSVSKTDTTMLKSVFEFHSAMKKPIWFYFDKNGFRE